MTLEELNARSPEALGEALLACCGSERWAEQMVACCPIPDVPELHRQAERIWFSLAPADWLEAFSKHPRIGERSGAKWSQQEQRGVSQADAAAMAMLQQLNTEYENRFKWIFLICASGKSAENIVTSLKERLANDKDRELQIAASEQAQIMHLRLDKLLAE